MDFAISANLRVKLKESKKRDRYLDLARELKKTMKHEVTMIPIVIYARYSHRRIGTGTGELGNKRTSGERPNDSSIKIG